MTCCFCLLKSTPAKLSVEETRKISCKPRKCKECFGPFGKGGVVKGVVEPGWVKVRQEFESLFARNLHLGAQLVVYHGEKKVVDLYGYSSQQTGYTADTLQCVYSSGKNLECVAVGMLVDRGLLKYNDRICDHWPEFGRLCKQDITVSDVMRHEGGLPLLATPGYLNDWEYDRPVSPEIVRDIEKLVKHIEDSPLYKEGGERAYHTVTRGFIVTCLLYKVDPRRRTLGQFIREEISTPLGITYFCGMPEAEQEKHSFADMTPVPQRWFKLFEQYPARMGCGDPTVRYAMTQMAGSVLPRAGITWMFPFFNNTVEGRALEVCSAGCIANARAIAKVNACLANGGALGPVRLLSEAACVGLIQEPKHGWDCSLMVEGAFTQSGLCDLGTYKGPTIAKEASEIFQGFYGWGGMGGSLSLFDPKRRLSVGYAMNGMHNHVFGGPRAAGIMRAIQAAADSSP
eukprot:CAMPEP_0170614300 /NCGR_PEP_ID=MMETSP0224-20130122/24725_1 /TAXON_ID=285029 /ORGANISM="Togula jolla, Strain CCCM 725" /LENGTH=456 /DNA_ID=CAMNT_0010939945 /DNA_START=26 /DNA_END=1396 /DNA_ORIENTATION=-